jgi:hypothetical protein
MKMYEDPTYSSYSDMTQQYLWSAAPYLRQILAGLSLQRTGLYLRPEQVGATVNKVGLRKFKSGIVCIHVIKLRQITWWFLKLDRQHGRLCILQNSISD